jgi:hypothetical protein
MGKNMVKSRIAINDLILEIADNLRYVGISSLNLREIFWRFRAGNFEHSRQHRVHIGYQTLWNKRIKDTKLRCSDIAFNPVPLYGCESFVTSLHERNT